LPITKIAEALGAMVKRGRCQAFWRNGDGWNVSFNDAKGTFYDHARGEGGGILDLVRLIRGGDRKDALEWLAALTGISLDHWDDEKRRDWARRMDSAAKEAQELVAWKHDLLGALRAQGGQLLRTYHGARKFICSHDAADCEVRGDVRFDMALNVGWTYWPRILQLDERIDRLEAMNYTQLLHYFRTRNREVA
jgi:hypothetical protein